ncbi:MAG: NADH-quinone oxidoreductase subunit NuoB [Chloroflexota bacterium]
MFGWIVRGLRTGIVTTRYPRRPETMSGYRGRPVIHPELCSFEDVRAAAEVCPTGAITARDGRGRLDLGLCIQCGRCAEAVGDGAITIEPEFELAVCDRGALVTDVVLETVSQEPQSVARTRKMLGERLATLRRSLHIRHVDAGSDGAVELEIQALANPFYDIHRLGIFFTATPRHADVLLVTGAMTRNMELALRETYEAMPDPRIVIAAGTMACSGGLFGASYATLGGVDKVLPVDVYVPGSPPSPLSLLYALLLATERIEQRLHYRKVQVARKCGRELRRERPGGVM